MQFIIENNPKLVHFWWFKMQKASNNSVLALTLSSNNFRVTTVDNNNYTDETHPLWSGFGGFHTWIVS